MLRRLLRAVAALICLVVVALPAQADVFRPAYLQLRQTGPDRYDVLWKVPAIGAQTTLKVRPAFTQGTEELGARSSRFASGAAAQRWQVRVPGGLEVTAP